MCWRSRHMIADARARAGCPICLQVETGSHTQRWYERMGFRVVYDRSGWTFEPDKAAIEGLKWT